MNLSVLTALQSLWCKIYISITFSAGQPVPFTFHMLPFPL
jgi:hypothetical protein